MLRSSKTPFLADLAHLITLRASQMNGCAFCVDMHVKEAKIHGERELRLQRRRGDVVADLLVQLGLPLL